MTLAGAVKVNGTPYPTLTTLTLPGRGDPVVRVAAVAAVSVQATLTWNGKTWVTPT